MEFEVDKVDLKHLKTDHLDEMSRLEVTYKILKEQLREHQQTIIQKKEQMEKDEEKKREAELKGKTLK